MTCGEYEESRDGIDPSFQKIMVSYIFCTVLFISKSGILYFSLKFCSERSSDRLRRHRYGLNNPNSEENVFKLL